MCCQEDEITVSEQIEQKIRINPGAGLPCAVAHYIAAELGVTPLEVGRTADAMGMRCTLCQLGLFGYAAKGRPAYRIRQPMKEVPEALARAIGASTEAKLSMYRQFSRVSERLYGEPLPEPIVPVEAQ